MSDEKTIGEVYRLCERIEEKVDKTNGRVTALEKDNIRLKTIWSAVVLSVGFFADAIRHKLGL
jgi:hypothetical protein